MNERGTKFLTRRHLLGSAAVLAGLAPFAAALVPFARRSGGPRATNYEALGHAAATFTETLVNTLCPADDATPNGVACGLASFIDRELAGDFGARPSSQWPLSNGEFFNEGVVAANAASRGRYGVSFDRLPAHEAGAFLAAVASGRVADSQLPLAPWYRRIVQPLLVQASFSGPIYRRYGNRVFTKLF